MPKPISQLTVFAFDVHIAVSLLAIPGALTPAAQFLADPKLLVAAQPPDLSHFRISSLADELQTNHFWQAVASALKFAARDAPELPLPVRCVPKSFDVSLKLPEGMTPRVNPPKVRATVWLWPFGWSSLIEFSLLAPLDFGDLRAITETLRRGMPFTLASEPQSPMSLSDLFKLLSAKVQQDIAVPGKAILPPPAVKRHIVLAALPADPLSYSLAPGLKRWGDAYRAEMHSVLLERPVTLGELIGREKNASEHKGDFLLCQFAGGESFTISDFDRGSLLMLWPYPQRRRHRYRYRCLAHNLNHCSQVGLTLRKPSAGPNAKALVILGWRRSWELPRALLQASPIFIRTTSAGGFSIIIAGSGGRARNSQGRARGNHQPRHDPAA
jgi:hypothetical protein